GAGDLDDGAPPAVELRERGDAAGDLQRAAFGGDLEELVGGPDEELEELDEIALHLDAGDFFPDDHVRVLACEEARDLAAELAEIDPAFAVRLHASEVVELTGEVELVRDRSYDVAERCPDGRIGER